MKIMKCFLIPVSNFIVIFSLILPSESFAKTKDQKWKKQDIARDRLDTIQESADIVLSSKEANLLHLNLIENSKSDLHLKRALALEYRMASTQRKIENKSAVLEIIKMENQGSQGERQEEIDKLKKEIASLKKEQEKSRNSKKALFAAKVAGASLTCVSLYFQIQNILDSMRRVEIRQHDLLTRQNSLMMDQAKLQILEGKHAEALSKLESIQSKTSSSAAEIANAQKLFQESNIELMQWKNVVERSKQNILDAEEIAKIDQRAIARQRWSVGITAIGTLVIGLFGDKIILKLQEWLESDDPQEQEDEMLAFIDKWDEIKIEPMQASMLPSLKKSKLTPWEKSAVFFLSSKELELKPGVVEKALNRYKMKNPRGYRKLQESAKNLLTYNLLQSVENANWRMMLESERKSKEAKQKFSRYTAVRDNTAVQVPTPKPLSFGTKNRYKPQFGGFVLTR
jgi:hypothetical protein